MNTTAPTVFATPYRTADAGWMRERDALLAERTAQSRDLPRDFPALYGRRWGRLGAGIVMTLGAVALALAGLVQLLSEAVFRGEWQPPYSAVLLATLGMSVVVWIAGRLLAPRVLPRAVRRRFVATEDARTDVERLSRQTPARDAADLVDDLERRSLAWPLVGLSLVLPLTLHLAVACLFSIPLKSFDVWIAFSLVLTVPAHVTLAAFAAQLASDVSASEDFQPPTRSVGRAALRAWGFTVLVSLVPGVLVLGIPPLLVAATGGVVIPVMFAAARGVLLTERRRLVLTRDAS